MENNKVIYDKRIPRLIEEPKKKPKANVRVLFLITTFFMVILLVLYFQSPFSKLSDVHISGQVLLSEKEILKLAELKLGMSYFKFRSTTVEKRLARLVEVETVQVKRIFPNKLSIDIKEYPYVSFWMEENKLYPVLATGQILLNRQWTEGRVDRPILSHWPSKEGVIELSSELDKLSPSVRNLISEILITPIVSDPYRLTLYMVDGFEVRTSIRNFAQNMSWYPHIVEEQKAEGRVEGRINLLDAFWFEEPAKGEESMTEDHEKGEQ